MKTNLLYTLLRENLIYLEAAGETALQTFELTLAQFDTLRVLSAENGLRMGELSQRLLLDNSKMTRTVDQLVVRGLAERRHDASDRRAWRVHLTDDGATLFAQAATAHQHHLDQQFSVLNDAEQAQIVALFGRLRDHISHV